MTTLNDKNDDKLKTECVYSIWYQQACHLVTEVFL